jgi:hypothetical protein
MKRSLHIALVISISLASCAKHPVSKVSVKVEDGFSGHFSLTTCIPGVAEVAVLNETGEGTTSACPSGDVEITVIKPSRSFRIEAENVHVRMSHDGTPVHLSAQIP